MQERSARRLLVSLLLFGISFGFVEAAVVVYLRPHYAALQSSYYPERPEGDLFPLLRLEQLEAAGPMAKRLLARPLRAQETKVVQETLADLLDFYKKNPADAKKLIAVGESKADSAVDVPTLAAWTMLANQLLNLDEVLNK